jgi:hypothetical protein
MLTKTGKLIKVVAINLATFAVLLIIINWACGVYLKRSAQVSRDELPNYKDDPSYAREIFADYNKVQHQYEPFVGWKTLPYKGKTLTINPDGERSHVAGSEMLKRKVVHFFGGSTMWGEGSDDQHTIPALFNQVNGQYHVRNHGQLAYNTRQELDALISMYSKGEQADIVIFYDGVNDAAFLCPNDIKQLPAHRLVPMYREKLYTGETKAVRDLAEKVFYQNILRATHKLTYKPGSNNSPYDCISKPGKAEEIAEMLMKNWEMAHEIVTNRNGKFIAVLQPAAFIGNPKTDHLKLDEDLGRNFKEIYTRIQQKIKERNHDWIVDLTDSFDSNEYIFIDFCHVSPNGNEIIAQRISAVLNAQNNPLNDSVSKLSP